MEDKEEKYIYAIYTHGAVVITHYSNGNEEIVERFANYTGSGTTQTEKICFSGYAAFVRSEERFKQFVTALWKS